MNEAIRSERVRLVTDPRTGRPRLERVLPSCADPECSHVAGQVDSCYLDDPEVVRNSNPAYGTLRLPVDFVADERRALDAVEYARERAGIWEDPPEGAAADDVLADWPNRGTTNAPTAPLSLALDVSHDLKSAALTVCGVPEPFGTPAAFRINLAAGGVFSTKSKERSS